MQRAMYRLLYSILLSGLSLPFCYAQTTLGCSPQRQGTQYIIDDLQLNVGHVAFRRGTSRLKTKSVKALMGLARLMRGREDTIRIICYASRTPDRSLRIERLQTISRWLTEHGVPCNRLQLFSAENYGSVRQN